MIRQFTARPRGSQIGTGFVAAITAGAKSFQAVSAFVRFHETPAVAAVTKTKGMEKRLCVID
jgi:hypothetical protein